MTDRVAVILLAHNEASTISDEIREFHRTIIARLPSAELIVAEDGSVDGTRDRILETAADVPLHVTGGKERLGYRGAVVNAVAATSASWIFLCDGGAKHDPEDFWRLWDVRTGFDIVVGRKTNRQDQWYRKLLTAAFNGVIRQLFQVEVYDCDSGMRLLNRRVIGATISRGLTFRGFTSAEIVLRAMASGLRYREVPISYRMRTGESRGIPLRSMPRIILRGLRDLFSLRRELGR